MSKSIGLSFFSHLAPAILVLTLAPVTLNATELTREATRIVGGIEAVKNEFPFLISLRRDSSHICGGSLIRENWVLTAAHCVKGVSATRFSVKVGLHKPTDTKSVETFKAKRIIVHPEYDVKVDSDYDFALVELKGKSKFKPIALNRQEIDIPDQETAAPIATTAGWGTTSFGGNLSKTLLKVNVPLVSDRRCEVAYPRSITDRMICAGFEKGGKDSCQGDSGGPLFFAPKKGAPLLIGVVSWGEGCASPKKYGVYGKVNTAVAWIESKFTLNH